VLEKITDPLAPVRGLVTAHNHRDVPFRPITLKRWLLLTRTVYRCSKADVLAGSPSFHLVAPLLAEAAEIDLRLSLRAPATAPVPNLQKFRKAGLLDLRLDVRSASVDEVDGWLNAAHAAELPVRLAVPLTRAHHFERRLMQLDAQQPVVVVDFPLEDPFTPLPRARNVAEAEEAMQATRILARHLREQGIESNILWLPFCQVASDLRECILNGRQFYLDHQFHPRRAYDLAVRLHRQSRPVGDTALLLLLGLRTSYPNPIDAKLLPWILDWPWIKARLWAAHKLTRHLRMGHSLPRVREEGESPENLEELELPAAPMAAACEPCALRYVCDHPTFAFRRHLPGREPETVEGEPVKGALALSQGRERYLDEIDLRRLNADADRTELAKSALETMADQDGAREISPFDYELEGQWAHRVHGAVRWHGFTNTEKTTTPLARLQAPFTIAATIGGGTAEYIGFALGRHERVLCTMEGYAHTLALHGAADGRYVLLRDGRPVRPLEFEHDFFVPTQLGDVVEPRLCAWNIDGTIVTQTVLVWEGPAPLQSTGNVKFSAVVVCTRYARRLQALLQSIAHQVEVPHSEVEILVAYVPGLDPAEDVIQSIRSRYPDLRIVRMPFGAHQATLKGHMINETVRKASGDWILLLDADVVLPPVLLRELAKVPEATVFVAPDGRKMLGPQATAAILLGEAHPWVKEQWVKLFNSPGEFRRREVDGVPIGYCQIVRRRCFDEVQYDEYGHFEGADWKFGKDMRDKYGEEHRLTDLPVLHLDHGGSQWYGTRRQY
jgi:hypothetical protein